MQARNPLAEGVRALRLAHGQALPIAHGQALNQQNDEAVNLSWLTASCVYGYLDISVDMPVITGHNHVAEGIEPFL